MEIKKKELVLISKEITKGVAIYAGIFASIEISALALNKFMGVPEDIGAFLPTAAIAVYFAPALLKDVKFLVEDTKFFRQRRRDKEQRKLEKILKPFVDKALEVGAYAVKKDYKTWMVRRDAKSPIEVMDNRQMSEFRDRLDHSGRELLVLSFQQNFYENKVANGNNLKNKVVTDATLIRTVSGQIDGITSERPGILKLEDGVITKKYYKSGQNVTEFIENKITDISNCWNVPEAVTRYIDGPIGSEVTAIAITNDVFALRHNDIYNVIMSKDEFINWQKDFPDMPINVVSRSLVFNKEHNPDDSYLSLKAFLVSRYVNGLLEGDTPQCPAVKTYMEKNAYWTDDLYHEGENLMSEDTGLTY